MGGDPKIIKDKHMKFQLYQDSVLRDAIYFNSADLDLPNPPWDIAFNIDRNEFSRFEPAFDYHPGSAESRGMRIFRRVISWTFLISSISIPLLDSSFVSDQTSD